MESLTLLRRQERMIAVVRWIGASFALLQVNLYEAPVERLDALADATRPLAFGVVAVLVVVGLAAEGVIRRVDDATVFARFGLGFLVADVVAALALVYLYAFDRYSAQWTVLALLPLEGALRFQLTGALGVWGVLVPAYVAREVFASAAHGAAVSGGAVVFRLGVLLLIALFTGVMARDLDRQRRLLQRLITSSQQVASHLDPAEILGTLCREAVTCLGVRSAAVYAYDGTWFQPVAAWPPDALAGVIEREVREDEDPGLAKRLLEQRSSWLPNGSSGPRLIVPMRWHSNPAVNLLVIEPRSGRPGAFESEVAALLAENAALALATTRVLSDEQRSNRRLRYLEALRTRFVATIAHDLRLPLTVFKGVSTVLRNRPGAFNDEQVKEMLLSVERQANRLRRLADDLLEAARLDADKLSLHVDVCDLGDVIASTVADVAEPVDVVLEGDVRVRGDGPRLERVLWNLLSNAEKYGRPPFEVRARRDGDRVVVAVRDHGRGVPADQQALLFRNFAGSDDAESVGLGLAIVWQLVAAHGGEVSYEDARPGARFTLVLPVAGPTVEAPSLAEGVRATDDSPVFLAE